MEGSYCDTDNKFVAEFHRLAWINFLRGSAESARATFPLSVDRRWIDIRAARAEAQSLGRLVLHAPLGRDRRYH